MVESRSSTSEEHVDEPTEFRYQVAVVRNAVQSALGRPPGLTGIAPISASKRLAPAVCSGRCCSMLQVLDPSAHTHLGLPPGGTYYNRTRFVTVVQSNLCIHYMLIRMSETLVRSNGRFLALGSEQVVRADDVEVLDHRRSVHPALELLQEPPELEDRRRRVLDAVGQFSQDHECRAVRLRAVAYLVFSVLLSWAFGAVVTGGGGPVRRPPRWCMTQRTFRRSRAGCSEVSQPGPPSCLVGCRRSSIEGLMMRVFVAGATGAIGRQLVPRPVAVGHEVMA
jgi:hypothetical protein